MFHNLDFLIQLRKKETLEEVTDGLREALVNELRHYNQSVRNPIHKWLYFYKDPERYWTGISSQRGWTAPETERGTHQGIW